MYFSLIIVVLALAAQQTIADSQSPFAQQPQHYTVVQTDSKYPSDVKSIYSVQQQPANEIDSSKSTQLKASAKESTGGYEPDAYASADPIQQYVNSFAPDNANNADAASAAASGIVPIYSGYGNFGPYAYNHPGAFAVQSGYEGYLVPGPASQAVATVDPADRTSNPFAAVGNFIPSPRTVVQAVGRIFGVMAGLLGITVMGSNLVSIFCSATSLCGGLLPFRLAMDNTFKWNIPESLSRLQAASEKFGKVAENIANIETPKVPSVELAKPEE